MSLMSSRGRPGGGGVNAKDNRTVRMPQLTDRDYDLLDFVGRHAFVGARHVAAYLGMQQKRCQAQVRTLLHMGLIDIVDLHGLPSRYRLSRRGLRLMDPYGNYPSIYLRYTGLTGPPIQGRQRPWRHDADVMDWCAAGFTSQPNHPNGQHVSFGWSAPPFVHDTAIWDGDAYAGLFDAVVAASSGMGTWVWAVEYSRGTRSAQSRERQAESQLGYLALRIGAYTGLLYIADDPNHLDLGLESYRIANWHVQRRFRVSIPVLGGCLDSQGEGPLNCRYRSCEVETSTSSPLDLRPSALPRHDLPYAFYGLPTLKAVGGRQ